MKICPPTIHRKCIKDMGPINFQQLSQRQKEAMKDERTDHGAMDKSLLEQQICVSALIFCIVKKTGPILPTL